ncbi:MAG TPA: tocopherol cyclase family protein [Treponema sp.]|nr:tocopherol cyclase family protein [Treponema sp.]
MLLPRFLKPILFQGVGRTKAYFEGWYFKQSLFDKKNHTQRTIAIIPGISWDANGAGHAFIQTIDSKDGSSTYFRFPIQAFSFQDKPFSIHIEKNSFSTEGLHVDLQDDRLSIVADLSFHQLTPIKNIMGPYKYVPFMECNHGIISMYHEVRGHITLVRENQEGDRLTLAPGIGYIEKDWGRSMPSSWIWINAINFEGTAGPVSFFFSLAKVPWQSRHFNGFITVLYVNGREYRFATYRKGHIDLLEYQGGILRILLSDNRYKVEILVRTSEAGELLAPVHGTMDRRIGECNNAWVRVVIKAKHKMTDAPLFDGIATGSGVELVGDIERLAIS